MIVGCDIDGVLADVRGYVYLLPDWDEYFKHTLEFSPIPEMVLLVGSLIQAMHTVVFITGRPKSNENDTVSWLTRHIPSLRLSELRMRQNDDSRQSVDIKLEVIREIRPSLMLEDEPRAVEAIRAEGFTVLQVHGYRYSGEDNVPFMPLNLT